MKRCEEEAAGFSSSSATGSSTFEVVSSTGRSSFSSLGSDSDIVTSSVCSTGSDLTSALSSCSTSSVLTGLLSSVGVTDGSSLTGDEELSFCSSGEGLFPSSSTSISDDFSLSGTGTVFSSPKVDGWSSCSGTSIDPSSSSCFVSSTIFSNSFFLAGGFFRLLRREPPPARLLGFVRVFLLAGVVTGSASSVD